MRIVLTLATVTRICAAALVVGVLLGALLSSLIA
jgi:hypothetical protein